MIDFNHAARQIGAVWNMAFARDGWQRDLDRSVDGVFRSFSAMALAAPLLAFNFAAGHRAARATPAFAQEPLIAAPLSVFLPIQMLSAYADWCVSLLALVMLARAVGAGRRAAEIITGYNWLQAPLAALQTAPAAAFLLPSGRSLAAIILLPIIAISFALLWGYARRVFQLAPPWTFLIVIVLTLTGLVVQSLAGTLLFGLIQLFS